MRRLLASKIDAGDIDEIRQTLRDGGVVCFPTDTLYGLGVNPFNPKALDRIYELKGRHEQKPILLLVDSVQMARSVSRPDRAFESVAGRLWPGPVTLVVWAVPELPLKLTAGSHTIGLRWPDYGLAQKIIHGFGGPITATSANSSGRPAARSPQEAIDQLGSGIDLLVDAGPLVPSRASTVLDLTSRPPAVLREGPVSAERIRELWNNLTETVPYEP